MPRRRHPHVSPAAPSPPDLGPLLVGWREWVTLPALKVGPLRAKVDTGARTSALHAHEIEVFARTGTDWVRFSIALGSGGECSTSITLPLLGTRLVRSSNGLASRRPVIRTDVELLARRWPIELTLVSRARMRLPMLLGRQALRGRVLVDPKRSWLAGDGPPRGRGGP